MSRTAPPSDSDESVGPDRERWMKETLERFERPLIQYVRRMVGDSERARDVVQDAFLRLCHRGPRDLDPRALAAWLFRTARNRALDVHKKERRMHPVGEESRVEALDVAADPARRLEAQEQQRELLAAVERLPPVQQEVLRLKFEHGLSYREIAEVVERSVGTVGYLIHVALEALGKEVMPLSQRGVRG